MRNLSLSRRVKRLEREAGVKQERFVLLISCSDPNARLPDDSSFKKDEILPGVIALAYGGPLSSEELEELRTEYAAKSAIQRSEGTR